MQACVCACARVQTTCGSKASTPSSCFPSLPLSLVPSPQLYCGLACLHCESEGKQLQKQNIYPNKFNRNASWHYLLGSWSTDGFSLSACHTNLQTVIKALCLDFKQQRISQSLIMFVFSVLPLSPHNPSALQTTFGVMQKYCNCMQSQSQDLFLSFLCFYFYFLLAYKRCDRSHPLSVQRIDMTEMTFSVKTIGETKKK